MIIESSILFPFIEEIKEIIIPSQVRQIKQIDNRIIDIELFCPNATPIHMIFDTHIPMVYLSNSNKQERAYTPSQTFCMALRKHLEGSRLFSVEQLHFDRILKFNFNRIEDAGTIHTKSLYAELIPSAPNLILVDNDIIIDACLRGQKMNRFIVPGQPYQSQNYTNRMNFLQFTKDEILEIINFAATSENSLEQWLYHTFNGFSRLLVNELCARTQLSCNKTMRALSNEETYLLAQNIYKMAQEIKSAKHLYVYGNSPEKETASPLLFINKKPNTQISSIQWMTLVASSAGGVIAPVQQLLQKRIKSLKKKEERKIDKIKQEMEETNKMSQYKLWGNLLSIYAYKNTAGKEFLTVSNLFATPPQEENIPINPRLSISANSQQYFKKYAKMKTRLKIGKEKLDECLLHINYLENLTYFIDSITTQEDLTSLQEELRNSGIEKELSKASHKKKKETPSSYLTTFIDGFTVYIGKNNMQNEILTLHKAQKHDVWLHAKKLPGSHVIIETNGNTVPEDTIIKAASIAAYYSKGKNSGKVDVDYTLIKYVKKIPKGPPGLVNYTHQRSITVVPKNLV